MELFKEISVNLLDRNWTEVIEDGSRDQPTSLWKPPSLVDRKLNFDASAEGHLGLIGIGCLIHDRSGIAKRRFLGLAG